MAALQDNRDCALCGAKLASGAGSTSLNSGTHYLCADCVAVADVNATLPTLSFLATN